MHLRSHDDITPPIHQEEFRMASQAKVLMIWDFLKVRKKWWLTPIIMFTLLISALLVATKGSAVAPFIYTLF